MKIFSVITTTFIFTSILILCFACSFAFYIVKKEEEEMGRKKEFEEIIKKNEFEEEERKEEERKIKEKEFLSYLEGHDFILARDYNIAMKIYNFLLLFIQVSSIIVLILMLIKLIKIKNPPKAITNQEIQKITENIKLLKNILIYSNIIQPAFLIAVLIIVTIKSFFFFKLPFLQKIKKNLKFFFERISFFDFLFSIFYSVLMIFISCFLSAQMQKKYLLDNSSNNSNATVNLNFGKGNNKGDNNLTGKINGFGDHSNVHGFNYDY